MTQLGAEGALIEVQALQWQNILVGVLFHCNIRQLAINFEWHWVLHYSPNFFNSETRSVKTALFSWISKLIVPLSGYFLSSSATIDTHWSLSSNAISIISSSSVFHYKETIDEQPFLWNMTKCRGKTNIPLPHCDAGCARRRAIISVLPATAIYWSNHEYSWVLPGSTGNKWSLLTTGHCLYRVYYAAKAKCHCPSRWWPSFLLSSLPLTLAVNRSRKGTLPILRALPFSSRISGHRPF